MYLIGTFEQAVEVEEALAVVERLGTDSSRIMTVFLEVFDRNAAESDSVYVKQKTLAFEAGMCAATALSVIGASVGFALAWGPILWGLIGALAGYGAGFGLTKLLQRHTGESTGWRRRGKKPELAVIIRCENEQHYSQVREVLRQYQALSIGRIDGS